MEHQCASGEGQILTCQVKDCGYNSSCECLAPSIAIGDITPMCDTYTHAPVDLAQCDSAVAWCGVAECAFNQTKGCHAAGVTVAMAEGTAECLTFRAS